MPCSVMLRAVPVIALVPLPPMATTEIRVQLTLRSESAGIVSDKEAAGSDRWVMCVYKSDILAGVLEILFWS